MQGAVLHGGAHAVGVLGGGDDDDVDLRMVLLPEPGHHLQTVLVRQVQVEQQQVRPEPVDRLDGRGRGVDLRDSVIISALAMTAAHSTDPKVWVKDITRISNPPGTACYTYAACVALLKQGKTVNYGGATGPEDFNRYHNTFSGFAVSGFTSSDQLVQRAYVTPAQIQQNAG